MLGLALAISLVAGSLVWHIATYSAATATVEAPDPSIGYAFYSALDQVLASGDRSALDTLVSGDYVDHAGEGAVDRSADDLVEQLAAFRVAFPDARLTVRNIEPSAGNLVVSVEPIDLQMIPVAGLSLHHQPSPGGHEVLHIYDGKVIERWSIALPLIPATTFPAATCSVDGTINTGQRLDRIRLTGDDIFRWTLRGPAILAVESGSVRSDIVFDDAHMQTHHETSHLDEGSATLLATGGGIQLQRDGETTAQVLIYSTHHLMQTDIHPLEEPTGANYTRLASNFLPLMQQGSWQMSIARLDLRDGESVDLDLPSGAVLLLTSNDARIAATAEHGTITTLDNDLDVVKRPHADTIEFGAAATITKASRVSFQVDGTGDGSVWLITMVPTGTAGISAGPKVE
jgi:hypothetical protein